MASLGPLTLTGGQIRLEPLRPEHAAGLLAAGQAPAIWEWSSNPLTTPAAIERFLADALRDEVVGRAYHFAVIDRAANRVVGSTAYLDLQVAERGVEIGSTWYTPEVWGTTVNPEAKLLLMAHAFETWGAIRVMLKTDVKNLHSQAAIRKLGATYEGTLRNHRIRPDGTFRHSVMFSVIEPEWPEVKAGLEQRVGGR